MRKILVAGASVAGNTAAWWLGRYGFDVTVVELAPAFRDGGQNVDVTGMGRKVLRRMGLEEASLNLGTGEVGTAWVDRHGRPVARFGGEGSGGCGLTKELEILRGDLARLIHGSAQAHASFRFGEAIERVEQDGNGAVVTFTSGAEGRFDAVIIAEGVGSATRECVFPGENAPRWMDLSIAFLTIPRTASDDRLWRWFNATGGRSVSLRPDAHGTTRAMLMVQGRAQGEQDWSIDCQKAWLRDRFADVGWEAPRVITAMAEADDFYFDALRQVRMKRWAKGRVVLTGDAAWCATPVAGIGTTLAITGAYVLAGEMAQAATFPAAFAAYKAAMRP